MSNMNVTYHRSMVAVLSALIDELEVADTGQLRKELTASLERAAALFAREMSPMEEKRCGCVDGQTFDPKTGRDCPVHTFGNGGK